MARGRKKQLCSTGGFSLLEVLVASTLMVLAVTAMMMAFGSSTMVAQKAQEVTRACFLTQQIREMAITLPFTDPDGSALWGREAGESEGYPYDDIDDLANATLTPPLLSDGTVASDLSNWSQVVTVQSVSPSNFDQNVTNGSSPVVRVTVSVKHGDEVMAELTWLAFDID